MNLINLQRCSGVPSTILISVFSRLSALTHLRIKGSPAAAVPFVLARLPHLRVLDTGYNDVRGHTTGRIPLDVAAAMPRLTNLTLQASSVDLAGPQGFWQWMCALFTPTLTPPASPLSPESNSFPGTVLNAVASAAVPTGSASLQEFCLAGVLDDG